jgi:hypothetical protein
MAAFVFVLLPEKVIYRDKGLQTTESLVPEGLFSPSRPSSATGTPNGGTPTGFEPEPPP